ncbi:MAG: hypothetical protein D6682_00270 [Zetaproteobacteria bacterium]|nr:MAG: hypothetical protein D6682_00270 [Zetaproteobacteria bacterium]
MLHPALAGWRRRLRWRRSRWLRGRPHDPLSLAALLVGVAPARLLAAACPDLPAMAQWWVATPWHGQTVRDRVRLLPWPRLDWRAADGAALIARLAPLFDDLGMRLVAGPEGMLLLGCDRCWQVAPAPWPQIEEEGLPDRPPPGADGGAWMRLMTEVEMALHQDGIPRAGSVPVHGIWLWGAWSPDPAGAAEGAVAPGLTIAATGGVRADRWLVGRAEEVAGLLPGGRVPRRLLLAGGGRLCFFPGRGRLWPRRDPLGEGGGIGGEEELLGMAARPGSRGGFD